MRRLLTDAELDRSGVVANCRMNRERGIAGTNSYTADLRFDPVRILRERLQSRESVAWLDLCCGTGRALIEAAGDLREAGLDARATIEGIDLVDMFVPVPDHLPGVKLIPASLNQWSPARRYDLITCVHGLHYIGDKLGLISRAVSWLKSEGLFAAHLDLSNLKRTDGRWFAGLIGRQFKLTGLNYDRRHRLLRCHGHRRIDFRFRYDGADDGAGPNYTGQPAVNSCYSIPDGS